MKATYQWKHLGTFPPLFNCMFESVDGRVVKAFDVMGVVDRAIGWFVYESTPPCPKCGVILAHNLSCPDVGKKWTG
jgi:hypothetical protein